ncbi:Protein of unknown function (DUF2927) [Palleronia aestuarii]|uniref:DUF2927 family protein n=1 Tax=Palleronia aestuarii TaxID=568105 RepID=A0A2W7NMA4_9RHOB|nr:DUF2927 domain-containing protein [Palleronia aestuarii]PZX17774.1 Protein of unknown function (DUF2927) [Palleronia aestuarii]
MQIPRFPLAAVFVAALFLAGCESPGPVDPSPRPAARPAPPAASPDAPDPPQRSESSRLLSTYYARVQNDLLSQGLLRRDGGGVDTPFDADRLARTFVRVALFEEYATDTGRLVARETESRLHRWEQPVRIDTMFGASVPAGQRLRDRANVERLANRLESATGHPVSTVPSNGNFTVFIVDEDERRALGPELRRLVPGISEIALNSILALPKSSYCVVFALDPSDSGRYTRAISIIRAEHPDLLRLSCIHEEIAQGLGLPNDTPTARPSIFNDDEEFALLTRHDELLLKMLYDPRLRPGMRPDEAAPIARRIAEELVGGSS